MVCKKSIEGEPGLFEASILASTGTTEDSINVYVGLYVGIL
jgi:hypothetical protein